MGSHFRQASEGYLILDNGHALFYLGLSDPGAATAATHNGEPIATLQHQLDSALLSA